MSIPDFVVIGGGIVGLSVARELRRRDPGARIVVLEKEPRVGVHASGRNSGVLHAGFYYSPDSLKARFTRVGNERLTEYCVERGLPIRRCGKLVIARDESELPRLDELARRGVANGVTLSMISATEAREIEPRARVFERAIWSPTTATVDPMAVMESLLRDARGERIDVRLGERYRRDTRAGFVINAAGLEAASIARGFGFARSYRILPFRGTYLYSNEAPGALRTHLYPVPDPRFPFLGVHFTVTVDGTVKIGPTARPSIRHGAMLLLRNPDLRRHAIEEIRKSSPRHIVGLASTLADGVRVEDYTHWGHPGIRAQLYDVRRHALEMDFILQGDESSLHILNAVSPGFTCAMPFAEYVVDEMTCRRRDRG
ncbi:MAG: NAD(P)/FAD-dependent oxidoreductase [Thermoanaerobaculia bacterium]